jgi:K+ transporter
MTTDNARREPPKGRRLVSLALLAFGIVYGDIGTSPLYAIRECFHGSHPVAVDRANVLGVLSLIFWSLIIVVTLKYHVYVLRFDNRGRAGSWPPWVWFEALGHSGPLFARPSLCSACLGPHCSTATA